MLRFLRKKTVPGSDLLDSQLFDETTFYRAFIKDLKTAKRNVVIESPYLTEKRAQQFARTLKRLKKNKVRVRVNTREPRHHDKNLEIQAWKAIKVLRRSGVKVYICSDLRHRKLAAIDNEILWDGSLNILSQSNSKEVMRRTASARLCKQMVYFTRLNTRYW